MRWLRATVDAWPPWCPYCGPRWVGGFILGMVTANVIHAVVRGLMER